MYSFKNMIYLGTNVDIKKMELCPKPILRSNL